MNVVMKSKIRNNPYLDGNFGPIGTEDDFALTVRGEIPKELTGRLYRIGPNPQFEPRDENHHWFVGDGMIHAFHLGDGQAKYLNRWVRTAKWTAEHAAGRALFGSWGNPMTTDPSVIGVDGGVANTNIVWHGGRLMALEEAHRPFAVDPETLAPLGSQSFDGDLAPRFTAHPKIDPETGDMVFFGYAQGPTPLSDLISYGVVSAQGRLVRQETFKAPFASMVHDFMVTRNHVLFPILPLTASLERAMTGRPAFAWEPQKGAFVGVMARSEGVETLRWFETEANYVFHVMNAWEEGDRIIADVMQYERAPLFPNADGSPGVEAPARLARWTFDMAAPTNGITRAYIDDLPGEFPRIDERRAGLPYRHGWFAARGEGTSGMRFDRLAHIDHDSGERQVFGLPAGDGISEPVFIAKSSDAAEGDGFILATAYRGEEDRSDLLVFDAKDIAAGPIATAALPRRVPFGFHGNWVGG